MILVPIILTLVVVGFVLFLLNTYVPMAEPFKAIINFLVVLCVIVYLLSQAGFLGSSGMFPRFR